MDKKELFQNFFRKINEKRRFSIRDGHDDRELWYMYLSPMNVFTAALALLLILLVALMTLVAYTPILDLIPGYPGNRSREMLVTNIMRLDSMERQLSQMQVYSDNMSLILDGKIPTTRTVVQSVDSAKFSRDNIVPPSREDSLLRYAIESGNLFAQNSRAPSPERKGIMQKGLIAPVKGVVTSHFNPKENRFGVGVATASDQQVVSIGDGTVVVSQWTPTDGYLIGIQHADNLMSVYRRSVQSIKGIGARVKAGEVIGYTGEGISGERGKGMFEFELWHNGLPVDPESYIVF